VDWQKPYIEVGRGALATPLEGKQYGELLPNGTGAVQCSAVVPVIVSQQSRAERAAALCQLAAQQSNPHGHLLLLCYRKKKELVNNSAAVSGKLPVCFSKGLATAVLLTPSCWLSDWVFPVL